MPTDRWVGRSPRSETGIAGGWVVVATENDTIYSLDSADGTIVWQTHLGEPVAGSSLPCGNVDLVGITGTPVIDAAASRIYAVGLVQPGQPHCRRTSRRNTLARRTRQPRLSTTGALSHHGDAS